MQLLITFTDSILADMTAASLLHDDRNIWGTLNVLPKMTFLKASMYYNWHYYQLYYNQYYALYPKTFYNTLYGTKKGYTYTQTKQPLWGVSQACFKPQKTTVTELLTWFFYFPIQLWLKVTGGRHKPVKGEQTSTPSSWTLMPQEQGDGHFLITGYIF